VLSRLLLDHPPHTLPVVPLGQVEPDPRRVTSLDHSWRFAPCAVPGAEDPAFDDSGWATVDLPHTWNDHDGQDGGNDYRRGVGWYRTHCPVPGDQAGRVLFLKFDGASLITGLYVNGTFVGEHRGGFAAFAWDVTPYLALGRDNVLAVTVSNAFHPDVPPLECDFTIGGGLYRHVRLISTDPLHVSLADFASPGVYLTPTNVSAAAADLRVTTRLRNDGSSPRAATVRMEILDHAGAVVTALDTAEMLGAGAGRDIVQSTTLIRPRLWEGRADPYLYRVRVRVIDGASGAEVDRVEQPLGLRHFRVDPAAGFFLNGRPLDLHGVACHQDRLDKGWATSEADQAEDVGLIADLGATFVRLAHYQHPPQAYDLLDRLGLIAWSEIPLVSRVTDSPAFFANVRQQLVELIRQNYNHPSVLFWGLYNEVADDPTTRALVGQLVELAHAEDPTRLTTAASCLSEGAEIHSLPDVIAFNKYFGWYYGQASDLGPWADALHRAYPGRAVGISEYGAGASIHQHSEDPAPPSTLGPWHPEEYQALVHEGCWSQLEARPFLWAKVVWNMFDFACDSRHEGDAPGRNDKGLVTYDRGTRKDAYHWYQAHWSSAPVLYIAGRRHVERPTAAATVKVYSNLDAVQLVVNGVPRETLSRPDRLFRWTDVRLRPGANRIEARGKRGEDAYSDEVILTGSGGSTARHQG
jgi:beta-galactosidase